MSYMSYINIVAYDVIFLSKLSTKTICNHCLMWLKGMNVVPKWMANHRFSLGPGSHDKIVTVEPKMNEQWFQVLDVCRSSKAPKAPKPPKQSSEALPSMARVAPIISFGPLPYTNYHPWPSIMYIVVEPWHGHQSRSILWFFVVNHEETSKESAP